MMFLGEIGLFGDVLPDKDLGNFGSLPNIGFIRQLAGEYSDSLELMPYQDAGNRVKLALCAYLEPDQGEGRVIAFLCQDDFPPDKDSLLKTLARGKEKLNALRKYSDRFSRSSINFAVGRLNQLSEKISQQ